MTALSQDLTVARAGLAALTSAVMKDRGPHVSAVMAQVRAMRKRADVLAPLVADRDFARAEWREADAALVGAQRRLAEPHSSRPVARPEPEGPKAAWERVMAERSVEYARAATQTAHDRVTHAQDVLLDRADGDPVTQADATTLWRAAADLDLDALNVARLEVGGLRDEVWRAELVAARTEPTTVLDTGEPDPLGASPDLDYGAIGATRATDAGQEWSSGLEGEREQHR